MTAARRLTSPSCVGGFRGSSIGAVSYNATIRLALHRLTNV